MAETPTGNHDVPEDILEALEADAYANRMDDIMLDIDDLNPEICPPDRRFLKEDCEAWVYEHGNIAELVFVKTS